jgi:hypothetical protein
MFLPPPAHHYAEHLKVNLDHAIAGALRPQSVQMAHDAGGRQLLKWESAAAGGIRVHALGAPRHGVVRTDIQGGSMASNSMNSLR